MKKLLAILLALVMCMTLLPLAALAEGETAYYVAGTLPGLIATPDWSPNSENGKMTQNGDVWTKTFKNVPVGNYEFKITDGTWDNGNNWGNNGNNVNVNVSEECDVTITFDANTKKIKVDTGANDEEITYDYYVAGTSELCGIGWSENASQNGMTKNGDVYEKTYTQVPAGVHQLKITDGTWDNCWGGDGPGGNYLFYLSEACAVKITFNADTKTITVTAEKLAELPKMEPEKVAIVGTLVGTWNETGKDQNLMTGEDGVYTYTVKNVTKKEDGYQLKFALNGSWQPKNIGGEYAGSGVEFAGNYDTDPAAIVVTIPYDKAEVEVKLDLSNADITGAGIKVTVTVKEVVETPAPTPGTGDETPAPTPGTGDETPTPTPGTGDGNGETGDGGNSTTPGDGDGNGETGDGGSTTIPGDGNGNGETGDGGNSTTPGTGDETPAPTPGTGNETDKPEGDDNNNNGSNDKDEAKTITIYAKVPADWTEAYLYSWPDGGHGDPAWPGVKMTASKTHAGWYEAEIPENVQNVIVNAGSGKPQTVDLKLVSGSYFIVLGEAGADGKYSAKLNATADTATAPDNKDDKNDKDNTVTPDNKNDKDDTAAPAPDSKTITIYAQVPADWAEVYLYTWQDGTNGDPAWPGTKMTASKTNAGWYELTIPADTQNVIVNAGNGNPQTVDLKLVSGSNYIVVGEAGEDGKYSAKMSSAPTGDSTELVAIAAALLMAATGMVTTVAGKKKFF